MPSTTMISYATGVHTLTDGCHLHGCQPIEPRQGRHEAPKPTVTMTEAIQLTQKAREAIDRLYADWEREGGPSPDITDEINAAAEALGYQRIARNAEAHVLEDEVYELRCWGDKAKDQLADMKIAQWLTENGRTS